MELATNSTNFHKLMYETIYLQIIYWPAIINSGNWRQHEFSCFGVYLCNNWLPEFKYISVNS